MTERIPPTQSEEQSFSRSFFGYDALEVRAFVAQMNDQLERLQLHQDSLLSGNGAVNDQDLAVVIDSAVGDISDVLEAARVAAKKIRDRAEHEASDGLATAAERARKILASAEADAFVVRQSAWDTSTEALESVKTEGARMRTAAERDALEIIGNAERKAHRKLAAARRDSENGIQTAGIESERMLGLARAKGKEIIRAAEDRAETVREQVAALERRHQEMLAEVTAFHAKLEGPSGGSDASQTSTVRVIHPGQAEPDDEQPVGVPETPATATSYPDEGVAVATARTVGWADGTESVRLVETPTVIARVEVDALELADEVARLRREVVAKDADPVSDREDSREDEEPERVRLVRGPPGSPGRTVASRESFIGRTWTGVSESGPTDELAALFLELRMKEATTAKATVEISGPERILSPLELYDRKLLPVTNRALRAVKRQLIDIQGEQIKALDEDPHGWQPERSDLASYLIHVLSVMEREAFERGYGAAAELTGARLPTPRGEVSVRGGEPFISGLFDEVVETVQDARATGRTSRDISRAVARVYRLWRTDEAERRLRFLAGRAYHRGVMSGMRTAGIEEFRVEVNKGCGVCAALAGEVLAENDVPMVPADAECRCMVLPA